jgi:hypothetical protein
MTGHTRASVSAQATISGRALSPKAIPVGGNAALLSSAVVQAALGIEFALSGLNKLADPDYVANFSSFVRANPGSSSGPLSVLVQQVVLPYTEFFASLLKVTELVLGPVLLIGAFEIGYRRFSGRLGVSRGYEASVALVAAFAGLTAAGLAFSIFVLMGGVVPTVMPGRAFTTAIPVELLIVPLGLSIAWLESRRFLLLRRKPASAVTGAGR